MGNKYGSNIRTYTARNLVWDCAANQPVPFLMAAPADFTINTIYNANPSMLQVFYKAQMPVASGVQADWNPASKVTIKRAGIFCNFADGLVQKMDTSRVTMTIEPALFDYTTLSVGTANLTAGSNLVTGTGLTLYSAGDYFYDWATGYSYVVKIVVSATELYLTDYARSTSVLGSIIKLTKSLKKPFVISNIATLNTMYEAEIFYPYTPVTAAKKFNITCQLGIDNLFTQSLDFYTKTIDPAFNGSPVSFDSVIELEVTPA